LKLLEISDFAPQRETQTTPHIPSISGIGSRNATEINVKAIQRRYSEAWKSHDPDAITALHALDTRFAPTGVGSPTS
jgi:hypothetical protein